MLNNERTIKYSPRLARNAQRNALDVLYRDPRLCESLKLLKRTIPTHLSLKEERTRKAFLSRGGIILRVWGLHSFPHNRSDSFRWLAWLWRHWDPDTGRNPVLPSTIREPQLAHWNMTILESLQGSHKHKWVSITFFPGVSRKQATQAAHAAYERVNTVWEGKTKGISKGGRPGLTETERAAMDNIFVQIGLPKNRQGLRQADQLRKVKAMINDSSGSVLKDTSQSTIANQYRIWRTTQGSPPSKYHKD